MLAIITTVAIGIWGLGITYVAYKIRIAPLMDSSGKCRRIVKRNCTARTHAPRTARCMDADFVYTATARASASAASCRRRASGRGF